MAKSKIYDVTSTPSFGGCKSNGTKVMEKDCLVHHLHIQVKLIVDINLSRSKTLGIMNLGIKLKF